MDTDDPLELEWRRRIFDRITQNPGTHFRELQRLLDVPVGMLDYHLKYLEKRGLVASKSEEHYTRYYAESAFDPASKEILSFLRQELPRGIILYIMMHPGCTHGQVLGSIDVTGATLSYHVKRMVTAGVVKAEKSGRETMLGVNEPEKVADLLITHRRSFLDKLVDGFVSAWLAKR
jgi:predicted transcriptional regulator